MHSGMIHIYAGKGSTLIALGLSTRALGAGFKVRFIRFPHAPSLPGDLSSFMNNEDFHYLLLENQEKAIILDRLSRELTLGKTDMIVLDGITDIVAPEGILDEIDLIRLIRDKRGDLELVMTGESVLPSIEEIADVVSHLCEME